MPHSDHHHSEADTRAQYIDPGLASNGWQPHEIRREYYFTDGRKLFGNRRGQRCYVDYLLQHNKTNLAIIEAKKASKEPTEGLQQAIDYAQKLKVRFVFATNGKKIYQFDLNIGKGYFIDAFPAPHIQYELVVTGNTTLKERLLREPYYLEGPIKPHYYQEIAIQKVMEAIAEGQKRLLLTLATGTGKTQIAFQVVHKLLKSKWNLDGADRRPKILFLADRNVLADQAINTFNPYEKDLVKINGDEIRERNGIVPTNAYIFFAIYQAIAERENIGGYYTHYPKDFFDLIIIDECHRGSANEEGSWRAILDYFDSAVHLGLTATPKHKANIDTYSYFKKPLYEYSLKEGINDGFLTPYKIKRIRTNLDEYIYTSDDEIVKGEVVKDLYEMSDFDRNIIIPERTEMIAKAIIDNIRSMDKTIVFCVNQAHALTMRDMINKHKDVPDSNYCVRVTSDEGIIGRRLLEQFQNNDKDIPVILTSSQMLTTGVDARNVRNIVLCRSIQSIVEFKQIVGRGTRIFDGKDFFTIIDFTGATRNFYDPEWDGPAEGEPDYGGREKPDKAPKPEVVDSGADEPYEKLEVKLSNGRQLRITDIEVRFAGPDGKPMSAKEFLEHIISALPGLFSTEEELRTLWANPDTREKLLLDLESLGFDGEHLEAIAEMVQAKDSDYFDLLAYLTFNKDMLTRHQRTQQVIADQKYFGTFKNEQAKQFLYFMLHRYEKDGIKELAADKLPQLIQLAKLGTAKEAGIYFGGIQNLRDAYYNIQERLYQP